MALPVTRTFSGVAGNIPTADETQWAFNRTNAVGFKVVTTAPGYAESTDHSADTAMHWTGDTFAADHYSEIVLSNCTTVALGSGYGPCVRMITTDATKTYYRLIVSTGGWEFGICNNPAFTSLASSATPTFTTGDTVRLSVSGSSFIATKNGTPFGSLPTNGTLTTGAPGVAHSSTAATNDGIDSWTGDNNTTTLWAQSLM